MPRNCSPASETAVPDSVRLPLCAVTLLLPFSRRPTKVVELPFSATEPLVVRPVPFVS